LVRYLESIPLCGDIESSAREFIAFSRNLEVRPAMAIGSLLSLIGMRRRLDMPRALPYLTPGMALRANFQTSGSCP
jgi:hypothetical protein